MEKLELNSKNLKEFLCFEDFCKNYPIPTKLDEQLYKKYLYFLNDSDGACSEIFDQRIYYSYIFKSFGWHMYVLNYEFSDNIYCLTTYLTHHSKIKHTYSYNSVFFLKESSLITVGENMFDYYKKGYTPGCLLDVIFILNLGEQSDDYRLHITINEISVPKIKYNTKFKQRLNYF